MRWTSIDVTMVTNLDRVLPVLSLSLARVLRLAFLVSIFCVNIIECQNRKGICYNFGLTYQATVVIFRSAFYVNCKRQESNFCSLWFNWFCHNIEIFPFSAIRRFFFYFPVGYVHFKDQKRSNSFA